MNEQQTRIPTPWNDEEIATLPANTDPRCIDMTRPDQSPARTVRAAELTTLQPRSARHWSASSIHIASLMKDGKERSAQEILIALDLSIEQLRVQLRKLSAEGPGQLLHVSRVETSKGTQVYAYGPGKNAVRKRSTRRKSVEDKRNSYLTLNLLPPSFEETGYALDMMIRSGIASSPVKSQRRRSNV